MMKKGRVGVLIAALVPADLEDSDGHNPAARNDDARSAAARF